MKINKFVEKYGLTDTLTKGMTNQGTVFSYAFPNGARLSFSNTWLKLTPKNYNRGGYIISPTEATNDIHHSNTTKPGYVRKNYYNDLVELLLDQLDAKMPARAFN